MGTKKLLKVFIIAIFAICLVIPKCYATSTALLSTSKSTVQAGDTVELYIDLGIDSIAYDLKISENDENLITKKEITSNIGKGTESRIYLIQIASAENRTVYKPGTRAAVLKYTLSENIKENKTLTITVSGDIAGKSSSEKNTFNESISINITPKTSDSTQESNQNSQQANKVDNKQNNTQQPETVNDVANAESGEEENAIVIRVGRDEDKEVVDSNNMKENKNLAKNLSNSANSTNLNENTTKIQSKSSPITGDNIMRFVVILGWATIIILIVKLIKKRK